MGTVVNRDGGNRFSVWRGLGLAIWWGESDTLVALGHTVFGPYVYLDSFGSGVALKPT